MGRVRHRDFPGSLGITSEVAGRARQASGGRVRARAPHRFQRPRRERVRGGAGAQRAAMSADAAGAHGPQMRDDDETVDYLAGGSRTDVQKRLFNLFQTLGFDAVFAIIVFMNLITVIIESDIQAKGEDTPTSLRIVNYIFLALYMLEIGLRIYVFRFAFFKLPWNCVDLGRLCPRCPTSLPGPCSPLDPDGLHQQDGPPAFPAKGWLPILRHRLGTSLPARWMCC